MPLVVERALGASDRVALAFDDGPDPEHTMGLLDVFLRGGGRGTFFLVGERAMLYPGVRALDYAKLCAETDSTDRQLRCGQRARAFRGLFRPPKGTLLTGLSLLYAALHRRPHVLWSIDPRDCRAESVGEILREIRRCGGASSCCTTTNGRTVSPVDNLLEEMGRRGLKAVTVSELLRNESVATT